MYATTTRSAAPLPAPRTQPQTVFHASAPRAALEGEYWPAAPLPAPRTQPQTVFHASAPRAALEGEYWPAAPLPAPRTQPQTVFHASAPRAALEGEYWRAGHAPGIFFSPFHSRACFCPPYQTIRPQERRSMRGRTKKHQIRFWSTFSLRLRIWPILCTQFTMMARVVV